MQPCGISRILTKKDKVSTLRIQSDSNALILAYRFPDMSKSALLDDLTRVEIQEDGRGKEHPKTSRGT